MANTGKYLGRQVNIGIALNIWLCLIKTLRLRCEEYFLPALSRFVGLIRIDYRRATSQRVANEYRPAREGSKASEPRSLELWHEFVTMVQSAKAGYGMNLTAGCRAPLDLTPYSGIFSQPPMCPILVVVFDA
jgi:hypothetical protein